MIVASLGVHADLHYCYFCRLNASASNMPRPFPCIHNFSKFMQYRALFQLQP